jgi:predicted phage terminase large subunit-like protein
MPLVGTNEDRQFRREEPNWHIDLIAQWLDRVRTGHCRRLIINVPPRHLKSHIASICFPAWVLGHDPNKKLMCVSYAQSLSDDFARHSRNLMRSDVYCSIFDTRLGDKDAVAEYETTKGGSRFSTSVEGVVTGRGADIIIIDDPLKADDAASDKLRTDVNEWYNRTLSSRLNDLNRGSIVIVMQRLHTDDLVAHVQKTGQRWEVVELRALAEQVEHHEIITPYGIRTASRLEGEALHPKHQSATQLNDQREAVTSYVFSAQYQQNPEPASGLIVQRGWLRFYTDQEKPSKFTQIIQSWDTAFKDTATADYSVCTTWGREGDKHAYLLDVFRARLNYSDLKPTVVALANMHNADVVLIEEESSGIGLLNEFANERFHKARAAPKRRGPYDSKRMRLEEQTAKIRTGFVLFPEKAPWLDTFLRELLSFPLSRFDDQVDSTVHALSWMTLEPPEPGILGYYRRLAEETNMPSEKKVEGQIRNFVRIKHWNATPSTLYLSFPDAWRNGNQQINCEADGSFLITEEEYKHLDNSWTVIERLQKRA